MQRAERLGNIGKMGDGLTAHFVFWRIAEHFSFTLSEIENLNLSEIEEMISYIDMCQDYRNAWEAKYKLKSRKE